VAILQNRMSLRLAEQALEILVRETLEKVFGDCSPAESPCPGSATAIPTATRPAQCLTRCNSAWRKTPAYASRPATPVKL
jgi:hypothetical protein